MVISPRLVSTTLERLLSFVVASTTPEMSAAFLCVCTSTSWICPSKLNWSFLLSGNFGYREDDIVMLTDDAPNPAQHPTKANIMRGMQWLVRDAQPNDSLFFHCTALSFGYLPLRTALVF